MATSSPSSTRKGRATLSTEHPAFERVVLAGLIVVAASSFAISFSALIQVAPWAAIPAPLYWAVPVFIDGAILVCALLWAMRRSRGESGTNELRGLAFFAAISMVANCAHALINGALSDPRTYAGALIAAMAPAAVLIATHFAIDLLFAPDTVAENRRRTTEQQLQAAADRQARTLAKVTKQGGATRQQLIARVKQLSGEGLSNRRIADRLGLSRDTVAVYLAESKANQPTTTQD